MNNRRVLTLLMLVNLGSLLGILVFLLLHQTGQVEASSSATVLRGSGLEIVDAQRKVRASIQIVPAGQARKADGSPLGLISVAGPTLVTLCSKQKAQTLLSR